MIGAMLVLINNNSHRKLEKPKAATRKDQKDNEK
ncbi:MAG: hypothetical protein ACI8RD_007750 [Bacillariaceae sp.]|jgi:hypothetical protein